MQHLVRNIHKNYTQLNNHSAQNSELSLQAKGLLFVLMSNKDTWKPYIDELSKRSKNGRDAHRAAYDELKEAGYIRVYNKSLGRGKGMRREPLVMDVPITDSYFEYWKSQVDKELSAEESQE
ncbi:transcriptional regulator [Streptococcus suis]|uniref:transcriptional regulator n=1 Tax=Streptococcus suis TaxID=1307 RepID=UPI001915183C|nr:transcriptional regulator [Streptococcus suis]